MIVLQPEGTLGAASAIAREAGRIILRFFQKEFSHHLKADRSPVTEADTASHTFLMKALDELTPGLPVVSEESAGVEASISPLTDYWLIDPLDGTKSFLKGRPEFTVNLALMREGKPSLGVVWAPALDLMYLAEAGQGAWRQRGAETPRPIQSRRADLSHMTVVASKDHSGPRVKRMLARLSSPEVTNIGSSLKFCLVAEGSADLYFRDLPTMEWDTAAAQCVVEAAGGRVLDLSGEPLRYGKPGLRNSGFVTLGDPGLRWKDLIED
jgi:3'(2'), 5'-bisphosphate nucleotidase